MIFIFLAMMGLAIGSFLNVVISRYPKMLFLQLEEALPQATFNLAVPRSHCPQCQHTLSCWHNIPLISYMALRGRCGFCRERISIQYPLVELITAAVTLTVFFQFGWQLKTVAVWLMSFGLIVLGGIDWKTQILPDDITLPLLWIGLLLNISSIFTSLNDAVLGAAAGYSLLWLVANLFKLIRKKPGMGNGDFKMLAMLGAWVGLAAMLHILLLAILLSLAVNLILLLIKKIRHDQLLPFGPWLAIAGWLVILFDSQITAWISRCFAWV